MKKEMQQGIQKEVNKIRIQRKIKPETRGRTLIRMGLGVLCFFFLPAMIVFPLAAAMFSETTAAAASRSEAAAVFQPAAEALSPLADPVSQERFSDLDRNHWAYPSIRELAGKGILSGYPDGSFRPSEPVTYGEFIKMAVSAEEAAFELSEGISPNPADGLASNPEKNLPGHWAEPYYDAGLNRLYYTVHDIKQGALDQPIPRVFMAVITASLLRNAGIGEIADAGYSAFLEKIRDVDSRTPYEFDIVTAYLSGILSGYPDGTFRPGKPLTRAEAAMVTDRLAGQLADCCRGQSGSGGEMAKEADQAGDNPRPPLVAESDTDIFPAGTTTLTIPEYGKDLINQQGELRRLLLKHYPLEGENMYRAAAEFAAKPAGPGKQGMRKQYFGEWPVLMERLDTTVRIFVLPVGYQNRFWETKPGEVNEEFF